jgi:hypothetical protein
MTTVDPSNDRIFIGDKELVYVNGDLVLRDVFTSSGADEWIVEESDIPTASFTLTPPKDGGGQ